MLLIVQQIYNTEKSKYDTQNWTDVRAVQEVFVKTVRHFVHILQDNTKKLRHWTTPRHSNVQRSKSKKYLRQKITTEVPKHSNVLFKLQH